MRLFLGTFIAALSLIIAPNASADVIFDAVAGDTVSTFSNGTNTAPSFSTNGTTATLTRSDNALSHLVSTDNIATLLGGTISETDVITLTWTVDSITGYTSANNNNGIEFGLVADPSFRGSTNAATISRFRADSTLANANRVGHGFGNVFTGGPQSENEETVEEGFTGEATGASFEDGFTVIQTISVDGVITQYNDIVVTNQFGTPTGGTTLTTVIDAFPGGFDFVNYVNGAHFYAGAQIADGSGGVITFSTATLELNAVPEPTSTLLLMGLGSLYVIRRRRA